MVVKGQKFTVDQVHLCDQGLLEISHNMDGCFCTHSKVLARANDPNLQSRQNGLLRAGFEPVLRSTNWAIEGIQWYTGCLCDLLYTVQLVVWSTLICIIYLLSSDFDLTHFKCVKSKSGFDTNYRSNVCLYIYIHKYVCVYIYIFIVCAVVLCHSDK